ncbi:MAG: hypothetical protein GXY47_13380 [Acidobacteria bacterium]|nr:hypothetical protein [Acidobacteriota bacterium]
MLPHPSTNIRIPDGQPAPWRCPKCGAVVYGPRDHHAMLCPLYRAEKQDGIYKAQAKERMREGGGDHCSDEYKKAGQQIVADPLSKGKPHGGAAPGRPKETLLQHAGEVISKGKPHGGAAWQA